MTNLSTQLPAGNNEMRHAQGADPLRTIVNNMCPPPDQADDLRRAVAGELPGPVVETFIHHGHLVEIVHREYATFAKFSAYITRYGCRRKCDVNFAMQVNCAEDARREIEREIQDQRNQEPQCALPPSDRAFRTAHSESD